MAQQQECARVMVYGMEVYLSAYQIKEGKMVNIFCILLQTTVLKQDCSSIALIAKNLPSFAVQ